MSVKRLVYEILAAVAAVAIFFVVMFGSNFFTNWNVKTWFKASAAEQPKVEVPFGITQDTTYSVTTGIDFVSLVEVYGLNEVITEDKTFGSITISENFFFGEGEYEYYVQCNSITFIVTGELNALFFGISPVGDKSVNLQLLQYGENFGVVKTYNLGYLTANSSYYIDESINESLGKLPAGTYCIKTGSSFKLFGFYTEEMFGVEINEDDILSADD